MARLPLDVAHLTDAHAFMSVAGPLLAADEGRNNLILGIAATAADHPAVFADRHFWVVSRAGTPVAAAAMTPPRGMVIAHPLGAAAAAALCAELHALGHALPGSIGPNPDIDTFVRAWHAASGAMAAVTMHELMYRLTAVRRPARVPGRLRAATQSDRALLVAWVERFLVDAFGSTMTRDRPEHIVDARLGGAGSLHLWETDRPVSLVGVGGRTRHIARIGPVYTPPEHRGQGFAGACVAAVSAGLLAEGLEACYLFTDRDNPTSNHIYTAVGYEYVAAATEYAFTTPESTPVTRR